MKLSLVAMITLDTKVTNVPLVAIVPLYLG